MTAGEARVQRLAAHGVHESPRQAELAAPAVLPGPHAERHRIKREPFLSQTVFEPAWGVAIRAAIQQAGVDHRIEPGSERPARCSSAASQVFETSHAEERVAHQQERPAIADRLQGARDFAAAQQVADGFDVAGARRPPHGLTGHRRLARQPTARA